VVRWDQDEPPPDVWTRWLELRTLATAIPDSRFQEMPWSARRYGPYSRRLRELEDRICRSRALMSQGLKHPDPEVRDRALQLLARARFEP
jgi:hypothetical protein